MDANDEAESLQLTNHIQLNTRANRSTSSEVHPASIASSIFLLDRAESQHRYRWDQVKGDPSAFGKMLGRGNVASVSSIYRVHWVADPVFEPKNHGDAISG